MFSLIVSPLFTIQNMIYKLIRLIEIETYLLRRNGGLETIVLSAQVRNLKNKHEKDYKTTVP